MYSLFQRLQGRVCPTCLNFQETLRARRLCRLYFLVLLGRALKTLKHYGQSAGHACFQIHAFSLTHTTRAGSDGRGVSLLPISPKVGVLGVEYETWI